MRGGNDRGEPDTPRNADKPVSKGKRMDEITINEKISFLASSENPLSAEIGIIRENGATWLYDVGNGENRVAGSDEGYNVVLSHFHEDHAGNIEKIPLKELYVSKETYAHVHKGTIVSSGLSIGNLRIFPLPSSHAKGCLGLEVADTYAFVGDALYCKSQNGRYVYNAQLLKEEIEVLKKLRAPFLLVSHFNGLIRKKEDVIAELETIYQKRVPSDPEIQI